MLRHTVIIIISSSSYCFYFIIYIYISLSVCVITIITCFLSMQTPLVGVVPILRATHQPHAKSHGWTGQNSAPQSRRSRLTDQKHWTLGHATSRGKHGSVESWALGHQCRMPGFPCLGKLYNYLVQPCATHFQRGTQKNLGSKLSRLLGSWHWTRESCPTKATHWWSINTIFCCWSVTISHYLTIGTMNYALSSSWEWTMTNKILH